MTSFLQELNNLNPPMETTHGLESKRKGIGRSLGTVVKYRHFNKRAAVGARATVARIKGEWKQ